MAQFITRAMTPQERTGVSLWALPKFEPEIWVVVDGGHRACQNAVSSGAGVVVLQQLPYLDKPSDIRFAIDWQHYGYLLEGCRDSTDAEISAAVKGLEQVASVAGQKRICLISDHSAVSCVPNKLLVIQQQAKHRLRHIKALNQSPLRELADLYLRSHPCQIMLLQDVQPEGFNLILLAAHQAAHELATKAANSVRQQSMPNNL